MSDIPTIPEKVRRLRSVEYEFLVDRGAFTDERVELLDGLVVYKWPDEGASEIRRLRRAEYDALVEHGLVDGAAVGFFDGFLVERT